MDPKKMIDIAGEETSGQWFESGGFLSYLYQFCCAASSPFLAAASRGETPVILILPFMNEFSTKLRLIRCKS